MKNTILQFKTLCFLIVLLTTGLNSAFAQAWDYVNFTDGNNKTLNNACIDDLDNVYTYGFETGYTKSLKMFNSMGNLQWSKDVSSQIDYSNDNTMGGRVGGIEYSGAKVYFVGNKSNKGIVLESGIGAVDPVVTWEQLGGATSTINDIKLKAGHLYVVGIFGSLSASTSTISFAGGTSLTGGYKSAFIAKYTYPAKTLVWAKKINASNITDAVNVDVDDSGNTFVTGHIRGTATFYDGGTPYSFTSVSTSTAETYLAKFDTNGNFDTTFGLKTDGISDMYNWRSYDVAVSNENNAVYWAEDTRVRAYDKNGVGSSLWFRDLAAKPYSIETNSCGDVYVTGATGAPVTRSENKAPCGYDYFGVSLSSIDGTSVWVSNSTSCISSGNEVLIDSNNKQIIIGSYSTGGGSAVLDIDTVYTSSSTEGYFIGRYDDDALNSCCKAELEIGKSLVICEGDAWPVLDITGQIPDFTSIQWFLNGAPFPQPSNAQSISTFAAGTYSVVVEYGNGCTATDAMTLVVEDCEPDCDITPKLTVKTKYCSASFGNNSYATGGSSIIGYLWDFGDGSTSTEVNPMHTYQVGGSYIVTLTVYGLDEEGNCCTKQIQTKVIINYSCKPECKLKSGFNLTAVGNGVFLFESNASTNGFTTIIGYEWTINGTVVSNNPYFAQPFTNGIVCLTVYGLTSGGECCSDSVCRSYKGKEEGTLEKNIKVFPNPTKNRVNLDFDKEDANTIKNIRVVDLTGRSIYTGKTNDQKFQIDSKQWPVGMYLITIEIDGVSTTAKIVKN